MLISCFPGGGAVERTPVEIPYQTGSLTYTGSAQSPTWINYDEELMTISGDTSATNAGTYEAVFTLIDNRTYEWSDGTAKPITVEWTIGKASVTVPSQRGSLTYTGSTLSPTWSNYDTSKMSIGGTSSGANAGTYTATFTLTDPDNYQWADGTTEAKSVTWTIGKASVTVPSQSGSLSYSGSSQSPEWSNYDSSIMSIGGTTSGTAAGTYTATFTLNDTDNYQWSDGTTGTKSVTWTIEEAIEKTQLAVPSQRGSLTYTGSSQSPTWSNYSTTTMTIGGDTSGTNAGTYTATFSIKDTTLYEWEDGTTSAKSVTWTINKKTVTRPSQSVTLVNGHGTQSPTWDNYDESIMTISGGTTSASSAGSYVVTFTLIDPDNYQWANAISGTVSITVTWVIKTGVAKPTVSSSVPYYGDSTGYAVPYDGYYYNFAEDYVSYNSSYCSVSGDYYERDLGTYTFTIKINDTSSYAWTDATTDAVSIKWSILDTL